MPDQSASLDGSDNLPADKRLSCASVSLSTNPSCIFCVADNGSLELDQASVQDLVCDDTSSIKLESLCVLHKHLSHESETHELKTDPDVCKESSNDSLSTEFGLEVNGFKVSNDSTSGSNLDEKTLSLSSIPGTILKDSCVVSPLESDQFVPGSGEFHGDKLEEAAVEDQAECQLINVSILSAEPKDALDVEKENISVNTSLEPDGDSPSIDRTRANFKEITDEQFEPKCGELQSCKLQEITTCSIKDSDDNLTLSDDIEQNSGWTDDQLEKITAIESLLKKTVLDLPTLQELAAQSDGFVSDSIRRRVWPRLLHLQDASPIPLLSRQESEGHSSYTQVVLDVERTLKRFPPGISPDKRRVLMDQLIRVILTVLTRNSDMHYYQGYHDVGITLLLVCGHEAAPLLLEELSLTHLREFLQPTMERTQRWLAFLFPMLADTCPALHEHMMKASVGAVFCLAWLITWYAHTLSQYRQVVRLYDFLLASPPLMPMYVAAEILRHRERELIEVECDMAMLHHALSQVPDDLPLDDLLQKARLLYRRLPPPSLADQVDQYLLEEKQREQAERQERERRKRAACSAAAARSSWVARMWALATPRRLYGVHGAAAIAVFAVATAMYFRSYGAPRMLLW